VDANLIAPMMLAKRAAPMMIKGNYGRIINVSSMASQRARIGDAAYITVKGGLNSMTLALSAEYGMHGITCNAILPGGFATETNREAMKTDYVKAIIRNHTFLQRPGEPWEIGGAALFLASPMASYVTGVLLPVDGGAMASS
jgi:gluconate 5-dehydrogenase